MNTSGDVDPRLPRLARGELTAEERGQLEAEAARDPALAADLDLYRPYDPAALAPIEAAMPGRRPSRAGYGIAGVVAVAAAAVVTVTAGGGGTDPLVGYELAVEGGAVAEVRGAAEAPTATTWRAQAPLTLLLRPEVAVTEPVSLSVFVDEGAGWARRAVSAEPTSKGAFELATRVDALFTGPGEHRLACVLARPGADPSPAGGDGQTVVQLDVTVVEDP